MGLLTLDVTLDDQTNHEYLKIDHRKKAVKGRFNMVGFQDKDSLQHVYYIPSVDITGYGETEEKASEMLNIAMDDFFDYITSLSIEESHRELIRLKWRKNKFASKQFSRSYVDSDGNLRLLNAVDNTVKKLSLTAA